MEGKLAAVMHAERSGGKWRMKDVRMLLFMHWARSIDAIQVGQLMFDDFSAEACRSKLKKVRKILGEEAVNFVSNISDVDERRAVKQAPCWLTCILQVKSDSKNPYYKNAG